MDNTDMANKSTIEYDALKEENDNQKAYISKLEVRIADLEKNIQWFIEIIKKQQNREYGQSSEKSKYDSKYNNEYYRDSLFNEAEHFADPKAPEPEITTIVKEHKRKVRLTTEKLPPELPVETVEHVLPDEEQACPECGGELHCIGKEKVRNDLKIIPAKVIVVEHVRNAYGCRRCESESENATIIKAPTPEPVIKGSFASPEAVAHIMVQKFVMGVPIYRQEKELERQGILLSRQTMSNWLIRCSEDWLSPIYELLHGQLIERGAASADETEFQVLQEPGRTAQQKSYLWVYRTVNDGLPPIILTDYQPGRHGKHPESFLKGFKGYLQTDGYSGYNNLGNDVVRVACLAHIRRKFHDALKILPSNKRAGTDALHAKEYCDSLFEIERGFIGLSPNERYEQRLLKLKPVMDEFHAWLLTIQQPGKSSFGNAVRYALDQWPFLLNVLLDGRLEISNNRIERTIKMFVIDRKNFLFANTPAGARASAVVFSIIETAIENGLNPYDYLVYVFKNMPNMKLSEVERLLPYNYLEFMKNNKA